jgi:hypothetical protein
MFQYPMVRSFKELRLTKSLKIIYETYIIIVIIIIKKYIFYYYIIYSILIISLYKKVY